MGRVEEIEERLSKATPGPWQWIDNDLVTTNPIALAEEYELHQVEIIITDSGFYPPRARDQPFIAHAREDIPYLLARVRELEAALARYADQTSWEFVDEYDAVGWLFRDDNPQPWIPAMAALVGREPTPQNGPSEK